MARSATHLEASLHRTGNRVLRPGDFADLYANPYPEFARLVRRGVLAKVAHGYYVLVPDGDRGRDWRPEVEGVALGIAVADYGRDAVALVGPSAARVLRAIPRALATATVATPRQRPVLVTAFGTVRFVTRNAHGLDRQRIETQIVSGWVTTPEQTVLDLADRPTLGGITPATANEAIAALAPRADPDLVGELAVAQRKRGALQRYCWVAHLEPPTPLRPNVGARGLTSSEDPRMYGLVESRE